MRTVNEIKDLIAEKREAIVALKTKADTEKRASFTAEETTEFNKLVEERKALEKDLEVAVELESTVAARTFTKAPAVVLDGPKATTDKDVKRYSFLRALNGIVNGNGLEGVELEMHQEAVKEARSFNETIGELGIPSVILEKRAGHNATGGATEGKATIETSLGGLIDTVIEESYLNKVGVRKITGLTGNFELPRQSNRVSVQALAENAAATASQLSWDKIAFAPERKGATIVVSKQLLLQSSLGIEAYILDKMKEEFMMKIELDSYNQVITDASEVTLSGYTNGLAFSYDILLEMERTLANNNIRAPFSILTNPNVRKKAKSISELANTIALPVWQDNEMAGYPAYTTTLVPNNLVKGSSGTICSGLILGNWKEFVLAQWGGLDILVDKITKFKTGEVEISADMFVDYGVTRANAFVKATGLLTT